ncbi:MAG TPA: DUF2946 family protein [Methylocystis sp.]|nr:DUF2946 family protein [Methylocystis sp.]
MAYMLVLQGVMVALSGAGAVAAPLSESGVLCATQGIAEASKDAGAPLQTHSHKDICCVMHCSGAAAPPPSTAALAPPSAVLHESLRPAGAVAERSPRLLLPVGSRAPPLVLV